MPSGFDDGVAAVQNAQQRARFIAATSGGASPPFPKPGMPPFSATPPTAPVEVRTGGPLEITAGEFGVGRDVPEVESIPPQETAANQFALDAEGRIDLVPDPPVVDDSQREFYREVRHKADVLSTLGHNQLGDLAESVDRFRAALPADIQHASVTRIWSRGNSLRRHLKAHEITVTSPEPDPSRLPPAVAATLGDLVDTFNVFIVGDPKGRELDEVRLGPQERSSTQAVMDAALSLVAAVQASKGLATPTAVEAKRQSGARCACRRRRRSSNQPVAQDGRQFSARTLATGVDSHPRGTRVRLEGNSGRPLPQSPSEPARYHCVHSI
jgi:hypothetical protein